MNSTSIGSWIRRVATGSLAVALVACGGGGGSSDSQTTAPPAAVARVEIFPNAVVLTAAGATKQLTAKAFDAAGNEVPGTITWTSTSPTTIAVSAAGMLSASVASGSTQITASAGAVVSAPMLSIVTTLPAGAVALTDAQIVGDPVETTPDADPSFDNTYRVTLTGIAAPSLGTLLINTESKAVAGRVLAVDTSGGAIRATLGLLSLREMFPTLDLHEIIDLTNAPVTIPDDIAAVYDVKRTGDLFEFTPKPGLQQTLRASGRERIAAATGTAALPPFNECEESLTGVGANAPLPMALTQPAVFSLKLTPSLDVAASATNGLERLIVKASPVFKLEASLGVTAAFEGKVECKHEMVIYRIPVGGPLSLIIAGLVTGGIGLEASGKVTVATMGVSAKTETSADLTMGLDCPQGADCDFVRSLTGTSTFTPTVILPSIGNLRVEPSLAGFGYVEFAIGNQFLKSLRLSAVSAKAGGKWAGSFAPLISQITDTTYKSDYKVSLEASVGVGTKLGDVAKLLGLTKINVLELKVTKDIAKSPGGAVVADKGSFVTGDTVNFVVQLDPTQVDFFPVFGPYNVNRMLLVRNVGGTQTVVGTVAASAGQTDFNFSFAAPDSGQASEFFAFVVTALLPFDLTALEVGTAAALSISPATATLAPAAQQQFSALIGTVPTTSVLWTASSGTITNTGLYTAPSAPGTYRVTAISSTNPTIRALADVTVENVLRGGLWSGGVIVNFQTVPIDVLLTVAGNVITGTYTTPTFIPPNQGTVSGTLNGTEILDFTLHQVLQRGVPCVGTFSGPASAAPNEIRADLTGPACFGQHFDFGFFLKPVTTGF